MYDVYMVIADITAQNDDCAKEAIVLDYSTALLPHRRVKTLDANMFDYCTAHVLHYRVHTA